MNTLDGSTIVKKTNIFLLINTILNKNYRAGRAIAIFIFWIGVISVIVGLGTVLVSAFLMLIEPDTVRTNWGFVPNYARWAYVGTMITGVSIAISGLLSALVGQLSVAIFDMSRKIQSQ
jgi:hypothetical protein